MPGQADRNAPEKVKPITIKGVRYESVYGSEGEFKAVDVKSKRELWKLKLFHYPRIEEEEGDVQDVYGKSMTKESDTSILYEDEHSKIYRIDLKKKSAKIAKWPVTVQLVTESPLKVKLSIYNGLDRTVQFDKPTIVQGGRLSNDVFRVKADGKEVPYRGMMAKRGPPDDFLELATHKSYEVEVDLSEWYPVPKDAKKIEVSFEHFNHFSKDDFELYTPRPLKFSY